MNEPNRHLWIDQFYKYRPWNPSLEVSPQRVFAVGYLQTQHGSLKFLSLRGSCYSINLVLPQCKLPLSKQNNGMGILFIKGLVLRQINSKGIAPAWVSAPSLILTVINEIRHIFFLFCLKTYWVYASSHNVKYCLRIALSLTQMDGPGAVCTADSFPEVEPGLVREFFSHDYSWKARRDLQ